MEELRSKQNILFKTLDSLKEAILLFEDPENKKYFKSFRDSLIQRFEYSIDGFWKYLKFYIQNKLKIGLDVNSPRDILREVVNAKVVSELEYKILIDAISFRNLTSHTYREETAERVSLHIPEYYECMKSILNRLKI